MNPNGYKKVGKKARHGRRRKPQGHGSHRTVGTIRDPIKKAFQRDFKRKKLKEQERVERLAW